METEKIKHVDKNSFARYDHGEIKSYSNFTGEGFLRCDAIVTRKGVFIYKNPDGTIRRELRHPDDVLTSDSLKTMKMIPVTNEHPKERFVTAENAKELSVGFTGEDIREDGEYIYSNFVITDEETINDIVNKGKKELSLGYTVDLVEEKGNFDGEDYDFRQTNIKYNHLSIVKEARAGGKARIKLDRNDAVEITKNEEANLAKRKIKVDEEEMVVEAEVADTIESLLERLKNAESTLVEIKESLDKITGEKDGINEEVKELKHENEELKEELEQKIDAAEFDKRVKARVSLLKAAESVLDANDIESLSSVSDIEIKKKIILNRNSNANLDGKSDTYISARFDTIMEDVASNPIVPKSKNANFDSQNLKPEDARQLMIQKLKNFHNSRGK